MNTHFNEAIEADDGGFVVCRGCKAEGSFAEPPRGECPTPYKPASVLLEESLAREQALQQRLNAADQQIDELTQRKSEPVEWGAPKTVRQLIQQLETLDQDLRPLSMLRVPGKVFDDGKDRTRAVHLSFSHEKVDGQWLAPFKGDGEKVVAFWCRMEQPAPVAVELTDRSPEDYAIEHAEYMAKSADDVLTKFQAYGLALLAVDEGGDDGEGELFEAIDSTRQDLQESLVDLRGMVYEFRKRSNRCTPL